MSGTRPERYQVFVYLEPGTRLPTDTARRLCCDADVPWPAHARALEALDDAHGEE